MKFKISSLYSQTDLKIKENLTAPIENIDPQFPKKWFLTVHYLRLFFFIEGGFRKPETYVCI